MYGTTLSGSWKLFAILFYCVSTQLAGQVITTLAGTKSLGPPDGTAALQADWNNQLVERVTLSSGTMLAISRIGRAAYTGDNIPAITAGLNFPQGVTTDGSGSIYISDTYNHRIRKIDSTGTITRTIGGIFATVGFAGIAPGYPDLYQINATMPSGVSPGAQIPVVLGVSGQSSPPVTISVR
jgi:hypothetical protein